MADHGTVQLTIKLSYDKAVLLSTLLFFVAKETEMYYCLHKYSYVLDCRKIWIPRNFTEEYNHIYLNMLYLVQYY